MNNRDYRREQIRGTRPGGIRCSCCAYPDTVKRNVRRERHKSKARLSNLTKRDPAELLEIKTWEESLHDEFLDWSQAIEDRVEAQLKRYHLGEILGPWLRNA